MFPLYNLIPETWTLSSASAHAPSVPGVRRGATGTRVPRRQPWAAYHDGPEGPVTAFLGNPVGLPETLLGSLGCLAAPASAFLCPRLQRFGSGSPRCRGLRHPALSPQCGRSPHPPCCVGTATDCIRGLPAIEPSALLPGAGRCHGERRWAHPRPVAGNGTRIVLPPPTAGISRRPIRVTQSPAMVKVPLALRMRPRRVRGVCQFLTHGSTVARRNVWIAAPSHSLDGAAFAAVPWA